jgi:hypothetical protein
VHIPDSAAPQAPRAGRGVGEMNMRQLTVVLALASACIFVASCSRGAPPPVATDVLDRLLLTPAEINTAIGTTGILVNGTGAVMSDDSANIPDKDCRFNRAPPTLKWALADLPVSVRWP